VSSRGSKKKLQHMGNVQLQKPVEGGITEVGRFEINLWSLVAPELSYQADNCSFHVISGAPTVYFYQVGPSDEPLNTIALSFTKEAFKNTNKALQGLRTGIDTSIRTIYSPDSVKPLDLKPGSVRNENFRKFSVQFVRAACSPDSAYIDFYNMPPMVKEQGINKRLLESSIQPIIRVYLTPLLFLRLLDIIEVKETSDEAK